jgi:hypothetical protein
MRRKGTLYEPRARRTLEHPTIVKQQGSKLMSASAQQVSLPLSLETDSTTTALALVTHINAACDPFSSESWPSLCDIKACRNVNGMRHAFAIRDVCGSGNPVLRRGGDHAVRVSGRNATAGGGWEVLRRFPVHRRGGKTAVFLRRGLSISPLRFPRSPRHRKWPRANTLYTCGECSRPYPVCGDERERCDSGHGVTAHGQGPPSALTARGVGR